MSSKYSITKSFLSKKETKILLNYAENALRDESPVGGITTHMLGNRPDSWLDGGYIERVFNLSTDYFDKNRLGGVIENVKFFFREIGTKSSVPPAVEKDESRDAQVHIVRRKISVLGLNDNYEGGTTIFTNRGESFKLEAGDLLMYDVDDLNEIGVTEVTSGSKLELILWFAEVEMNTRFDEFYIPPMEDTSDRF